MRTIIHDLDNISFLDLKDSDVVVNNVSNNCCVGCFKCWVKTPLKCTFNDRINSMGKSLLNSDEIIIISKCVAGTYSSKVKRIIERSISYVEPCFTIRNGEIHHDVRTDDKLLFRVFFYGDNISDGDKKTAIKLAGANKDNLNTEEPFVYFVKNAEEIKI